MIGMTVTDKQVDILKAAAFDEHELLLRAYMDCVEQFSRSVVAGRSQAEAIRLLRNWQTAFEKIGKHR